MCLILNMDVPMSLLGIIVMTFTRISSSENRTHKIQNFIDSREKKNVQHGHREAFHLERQEIKQIALFLVIILSGLS